MQAYCNLKGEAMGARSVPVLTMPRMDSFLRYNAPWSQLVSGVENIQLNALKEDSSITQPFIKSKTACVPHRDEFSETVVDIESAVKNIVYSDIDKWEKWDRDINEEVKVDSCFPLTELL